MLTRTLAAVLWDMDGTLIDSEPLWIRAQQRISSEFGASWTYEDGLSYIGSTMETTVAALQRSGIRLPAEQIGRRLTREVMESLRLDVPWRPGALQLVRALMEEGIPQAIVTTSPRSVAGVIADALPPGAIAMVVSGDDVTNRKPHPDPYATAAQALGVDPCVCVAIEDTATGLTSALAAGAAAIGIPNDTGLTPGPNWTRFESLRDLGIADIERVAARHARAGAALFGPPTNAPRRTAGSINMRGARSMDKQSELTTMATATTNGGTSHTSAPGYQRSTITAGIAHIGVGNFHRVHEAIYIDELLASRKDQNDWGIVGISLGNSDASRAKANAFAAQDNLYTVTAYTSAGAQLSRIVGCMVEYIDGPADPAAVVARLTDPAIRVVSLTITEGGYNLDEQTGQFRLDAAEVVADLARAVPRTTFGVLVAALARRCEAGTPPFTVLSCDNLRGNGDTARAATVGFARAVDPELAAWIQANVAFPNSMVDRIAPTVSSTMRSRLNAATGVDDRIPALTEEFTQWVLQDDFPAGRPAWEEVGVQMRPDVEAFEAIKGRLLNASHMLLSFPAALNGYRWIHDAVSDPAIAQLLRTFMAVDAAPQLTAPPGVSLTDYQDLVLSRFANKQVPDTVLRVAHDGAAKIPVFHRRTTEGLLAAGRDPRRSALLVATFRRYTHGLDDGGNAFEVHEPNLSETDWRLLHSHDPLLVLETSPFAAWRLGNSPAFVRDYLSLVRILDEQGTTAAIYSALSERT